jgi:hypothetical protein
MVEWHGRWFVRHRELVFDGEPTAFRRTVRPLLDGFRFYHAAVSYGLESITADEMVLVIPDGTRETWTRAPAD